MNGYVGTDWSVIPAGGNSLRQVFVRLEDWEAIAAELVLWKSNHAFASKLADDLTQDGIKERARIRDLETELAGVRSDLAMCEAKGSSLAMRERVKRLEAALRDCVDADSEPCGGSVRAEAIYRARQALDTVHDLMSACPPDGWTCKACGYYQGRHLRCLNPDCITNDRGVAK